MEAKSLSLREFNKKLIKNRGRINLEKIYQNDNYLIQTLKRTKRITFDNPVEKFENNLEKLLKKIYKEIRLLEDPLIKEINKENTNFKSDYSSILENFQNSTSKTFYALINLYKNKGYKIPSLNYNHNIFKVNPLIEENTNKIMHYFLTQKNVKTRKEILLMKSLVFLNKLNRLINKNKKNEKKFSFIPSQIKTKDSDNNIDKLKQYIQSIMDLINNISNLEINEINNNKTIEINDIISRNKSNKFPRESLTIQNENFRKSIRLNTPDNFLNLEKSYIIENNNEIHNICKKEQKLSDADIKRRKRVFNTFSHLKKRNISFKFNKLNTNKYNFERNLNGKTYINSLESRNKKLNIYSNKYSKTVTNLKKFDKNDKSGLPLFIRTQTTERSNNSLIENKKIDLDSKNMTTTNFTPFLNKNEFFKFAYKRLKKGNFEDIENYVKKYLNEIQCKNNEETEITISKYNYKNFKNNLDEIETFIKKSQLDRKTEKIYFNNFLSRRIVNSLENMREKEAQIFKFNKIITTLGNKDK
jgi:hypothetical protein